MTTTNTGTSWTSLIADHGADLLTIAYNGTSPFDTPEIRTPGQFVGALGDAVDYLTKLPDFKAAGDILNVAHHYLDGVPWDDDSSDNVLLRLAAQHLSDVAAIARKLHT